MFRISLSVFLTLCPCLSLSVCLYLSVSLSHPFHSPFHLSYLLPVSLAFFVYLFLSLLLSFSANSSYLILFTFLQNPLVSSFFLLLPLSYFLTSLSYICYFIFLSLSTFLIFSISCFFFFHFVLLLPKQSLIFLSGFHLKNGIRARTSLKGT